MAAQIAAARPSERSWRERFGQFCWGDSDLSGERVQFASVAVALGAEDFTNDMEIKRTDSDSELAYARGAIAVAARAAGVLALDTPFFAFRDPVALKANSEMSRAIGFRGRFAIHPAQLDIINGVYSPSEEDIAQAQREIEAFEEAAAMGRGSTSLDGKVIDVPVVKRAQALIDRARAMGLADDGE